MGKENYIACECGYEIFVPPHQRGKFIECLMCGNEVDTNAPPPAPHEVEDAELRLEEPIAVPPEVRHFEDHSKDDWGGGSSSPFEDDDGPDPVYSSPSASPAPAPEPEPTPTYSANAFVDEDEEDDAPDLDAPDPSLIRKYEGAEHTNAYWNVDESETCPSCGNAFRGDWDKQQAGDRVICYICSNQATEGIPERILKKGTVDKNAVSEKSWAHSPTAEIPEGPIEEKFWLFDPESEGFRKMIWSLALGLPLLTLLLVFSEGLEMPSTSPSRIEEQVIPEDAYQMPQWAVVAYWVIFGLSSLFAQGASFYAVLWITDRLPNYDLKRDVLVIAYTLFLLGIVSGVYVAMSRFLSEFLTGRIWMMLVAPVTFLIMCKILIDTLDFRIRDFVLLIIISGPVHALLALPMSFVYAALGTLVA